MRRPDLPAAAPAWRRLACMLAATASVSLYPPDSRAAGTPSFAVLEMADAMTLAIERQPLLEGLEAEARAARESAVAAGQLPDPALIGGLQDWPVTGRDAWSVTRDSDTQFKLGVMQDFPRAEKRRFRSDARRREAERIDAEHALAVRTVRREAALAWLAAWREVRGIEVATAALAEAALQTQSVDAALRSGNAAQADLLAARVEVDERRDGLAAAEQGEQRARHALSRWIGDAAYRPLRTVLPAPEAAADASASEDALRAHPQIAVLRGAVAVAEAGAGLARSAYLPDWSVEVGYGNRPDFSDMIMVQVQMDLPFFTANRQDRELTAALATRDAAQTRVEDSERTLVADARAAREDLHRTLARLDRFEAAILPQADARTRAAGAAWSAGRGSLDDVLTARRAELELRSAWLDLRRDAARYRVQLDFYTGDDGAGSGVLP